MKTCYLLPSRDISLFPARGNFVLYKSVNTMAKMVGITVLPREMNGDSLKTYRYLICGGSGIYGQI